MPEVRIDGLIASLRHARALYDQGDDGGRAAVISALDAVSRVLGAIPEIERDKLHMPLLVLMGALHDLQTGTVAPMLKPGFIDTRPQESNVDHIIQGHAAFVMDRMVLSGISRAQAARKVATALIESGYRIDGLSTPSMATRVNSWRDTVRRPATKGYRRRVYDDLTKEHPEEPTEVLLMKLERLVSETIPGGANLRK